MKQLSLGLLLVSLVFLHESAWPGGWGRTFTIELHGDAFAKPLAITDPSTVGGLSFWVGPGTGYSDFMGPVNLELSIVDWERGEAAKRPKGLASYEVRFLLEPQDDPSAYIVLYEPDPVNNSGYIYYPAKSNSIVAHGVSGTWRYASPRWNDNVSAAISEHLKDHSVR